MRDIVLSTAQRTSLAALREIERMSNRTQERLTTGRKVNSVVDDPIAYFQAKQLNDRSSMISEHKSAIEQGISTLEATLEGIAGIEALMKQMKGIVEATKSQTTTERTSSTKQFNEIGNQISNFIQDTKYNGMNLLSDTRNELQVRFSDRNESKLTIKGFDLNSTTAGTSQQLFSAAAFKGAGSDFQFMGLQVLMSDVALIGFSSMGKNNSAISIVDRVLQNLDSALNRLKSVASGLGSNVALLQTRSSFSDSYSNSLSTGYDKLVLADMNEEGANMVALQTRQQLGILALAISGDQASSILKLLQ